MQLEQTLQNYQIKSGEDYRISGGLYELLSGNYSSGPRLINGNLCGGARIDFSKSTRNTIILKEELGEGEVENIYIHHNKGPGRMDTISRLRR